MITESSKTVAVLGTGPVGLGSAMLLASRGHRPVLWSPTDRGDVAFVEAASEGALAHSAAVLKAGSAAEAVAAADVVLVAVPATAYRVVLGEFAAALRPKQPVLISGHLSFGSLYLSRLLAERGVAAPIAAWGTTIVSGRRLAPGRAHLSSVRKEVDVAALPADATDAMLALCRDLFGDRFRARAGLLAVALSNVNPQNHLAVALCNLTRIEKGEEWFQNSNITDAVGNYMEALDAERLAIAEALGVEVRTLRRHFHLSFGISEGPVGEMVRALAACGSDPAGPTSLDTRYVLEDAPFGLHPTALLGRLCGRPAALHEAGLLTLSALYGRDLSAANDITPAIGLADLSAAKLRGLLDRGWWPGGRLNAAESQRTTNKASESLESITCANRRP